MPQRRTAAKPIHSPSEGHRRITVHAHVFGRPYGAIALLDSLALVRRQDHCWLTDHARLAEP